MNEKEIAEIRRRFNSEKSNINRIRGCYVTEKGDIISEFDQSLGIMMEDETNELLSILKKTLSGSIGKNLINLDFPTKQVTDGEDHKLLMRLRSSSLGDDEAVKAIYDKIISTVKTDGNYMIMLAYETYDVPKYLGHKYKEGDADSEESFSYVICGICKVKASKPAIGYYVKEKQLRSVSTDWVVSSPFLGFMFPAFDDRRTNIYGALYYTKSIAEDNSAFVDAVFGLTPPRPAFHQKQAFESVMTNSIADECSLGVVRSIHNALCEMIVDHKESKDPEPLVVSKNTVKTLLDSCGVSEEKLEKFDKDFTENFGVNAEVDPKIFIDTKKFEVSTPEVIIKVDPEHKDIVETRVIDGVKYLLIRVDGGVEVNGVDITIKNKD